MKRMQVLRKSGVPASGVALYMFWRVAEAALQRCVSGGGGWGVEGAGAKGQGSRSLQGLRRRRGEEGVGQGRRAGRGGWEGAGGAALARAPGLLLAPGAR